MCTKVLNSLSSGEFGDCPEASEEYRVKCHERYSLATEFRPHPSLLTNPPPNTTLTASSPTFSPIITAQTPTWGVLESQENCVSN